MKNLGFPFDKNRMSETIQEHTACWMRDLSETTDPSSVFIRVKDLLDGAKRPCLPVNLWAVQNGFLDACLLAADLSPRAVNEYRAFAEDLELPVSVVPGG